MQKNIKVGLIILMLIVYFSAVASAGIEDGLIGYWPFEEGEGQTTADASGNGHDLTKSGNPSYSPWAEGDNIRIGNGAFYRNSPSNRVYFYTDSVDFLNGLSQFSLALWVKSEFAGTDRGFVVGRVSGNNDQYFAFRYDDSGFDGGGDNVLKAGITTTDGTHFVETSDSSATTEWQHLVFTWDANETSSGGTIKVYIDGVLDILSSTGDAVGGTLSGSTRFSIGRGPRSTSSRSWRGAIDDVRLYNRPLTQAEITLLASGATEDPDTGGVSLEGVGSLTTETSDASAGVTYTIKVTNEGNSSDTVNLTQSGDVTGTLSSSAVALAAGASQNVTLTIPGSALTSPGTYEVTVTGTLQSDTTKTDSVTTTTTINEPGGINLAGVGSLETITSDPSGGVIYTIRVTNNTGSSDTINLTQSGDVTGTLSDTSVTLADGASQDVTLTIAETALEETGVYVVTVTGTLQSDNTITDSVTTTTTIAGAYSVSLDGVGSLETETADAGTGITYTIKVTNNGNTRDTVNLSQSGDVAGTLSKTSVALASEGSENVTLTIPGNKLRNSGEYEIIITGTSQADNTKTDSVTTTTTITAVYSVGLAGVGSLTTETADAGTGVTYTIQVTNNGNTSDTINLTQSGDVAGTLSKTAVVLTAGASENVTLTIAGSALATPDEYGVTITGTSQGDTTETDSVTTTTTITAVYSVDLAGVGSLKTETTDASSGITYTIKVTNLGNTADTINLTQSGDVTGTLNKTSVPLNADASETVTLRIAGSDLEEPGEYEVVVTGTSQGDTTKTDSVTTTTTITAVYSIDLAGVGSLMTETADAGTGITYTIKVTNNGNTQDRINLSQSGDVTGTLNKTSVTLDADASENVTLTIPGSKLQNSGEYEVIVTGTSRGDTTEKDAVTTTTTITAVYSIDLEGVGSVMTETADASSGITYTIKVTNNGNSSDTINITQSGDVTGTLSKTAVALAAGASENVTLTIASTDLTSPDEYDVTVTGTSRGDNTKTDSVMTTTTITEVYDVELEGVGSLTTKTSNPSSGITYTIKVTNNGNNSDTIDLTQSGDVTGPLSKTSVTLDAGASENVTLTIAGTNLTNLGVYEVIVKGTSQGDDTKTDSVTTTTTITSDDIGLEGVGSLKKVTADASSGITYTIKVTNTTGSSGTINLTTSGDVTGTLSSASVTLDDDASENVTLTIAGTALTTTGVYDASVTATSQADSTKTATITTTTTIISDFVVLAGVGELMTETADASSGVMYTIKVTNNGGSSDTINLSQSGDVTGTLSKTSVTLNAGASENVTLTIPGSELEDPGEYEVVVTATSQNDNTETDSVTTTTTITEVYSVALAGVGSLETETADAGTNITYTIKVTNNGNKSDTIDLTQSGDVTGTLSKTSVTLNAGASENVTLTIAGSKLRNSGEYEVVVTATSQGDDTKIDSVTTTTTITAVYSIELEGVGSLETVISEASADIIYTIKVTNDGNNSDTIDLTQSGDVTGTLSKTSVTLNAGASENVTLTIASTDLTSTRKYEVDVTGTSQGDDTETDTVTTKTTIAGAYSVSLAGVGSLETETADPGTGVTYTIKVTNNGSTRDTINLAISGNTVGVLSKNSVTLNKNSSENVTLTIPALALENPGKYVVNVTATSRGDTTKTDTITTTTTITAVYSVELEGVGSLTTETADASRGVTYTIQVTNNGDTEDTINLAASGDVTGTLSDTSITLTAGASENVTLTIAGSKLEKSGQYTVHITAISQGDTTETDSVTTTTTITPVYSVDLASVGSLKIETADASAGITYTIKVTNNGNNSDTVALTQSGDVTGTLSSASVTLKAGASKNVTLTIAGTDLTTPDEYGITVTATSQGDTTKTDSIATTTTVLPVYDVTLAGIGSLAINIADTSEGVTFTISVTNSGNAEDTINLTQSGDTVGVLSKTSLTLAVGASENITLTIPPFALDDLGVFEVVVTATSQGDDTKTASIATTTAVAVTYNIVLSGVGDLMVELTDSSAGVSYTIRVSNNGSTQDTITLALAGDVVSTLSKTSLTLAAGAFEDVIVTIPGSELETAGEYEFIITATSQGDNTLRTSIVATANVLVIHDVELIGVSDLTTNLTDSSGGVEYTFEVTNNGNAEDTINLTTSGDADVMLSASSIPLAIGASQDVTLAIAGSELEEPGVYEVVITAISQGDTTKTDSLTTTTAVSVTHNIVLTGVGDLTIELTDGSGGIEYTIQVTNNGNLEDTVEITQSGDVEGTLSTTSLTLAAGASENVTLTIPGSELTEAGVYEVVIKATSQSDITKFVFIATRTTIREPSRPPGTEVVQIDLPAGTLAANGFAIVAHVGTVANGQPTSGLPALPSNVPQANVNGMPDLEDFLHRGGTIDVFVGVSTNTPDVIINEVMWAIDEHTSGAAAAIRHQWIELYNKSDQDVSLNRITLRFKPRSPAPNTNNLGSKKWTDRLSNVTTVFDIDVGTIIGWRLGNNHGQNGNTGESNPKEFISMYRKPDRLGDKDGESGANWLPSTEVSHSNHKGTPGRANTRGDVPVDTISKPSTFQPPKDEVIINEVYNAADDDYDWIELRALEDTNLHNWTLSYTRSNFTEVEILRFPDITLEEGEVYLFVNKEPYETDLAIGQNFEFGPDSQERGAGPHKYMVMTGDNKVEIPDYNGGNFYLILREAQGWERYGSRWKIHDVVGPARFAKRTLHSNTVERDPYTGEIWETDVWPLNGNRTGDPNARYLQTDSSYRLSVGRVWARNGTNSGWRRNGGSQVGFRGGVGYDRNVSSSKAHGTPGYHNYIIRDDNEDLGDGQLIISELMLTTNNRKYPQWIEIHNTSKTDAVDLHKDTDSGGRQGWSIVFENHNSGSWKQRNRNLHFEVKFRDLGIQYIPPNQTILIVASEARHARNSGNFPDHRVASIWGNLSRMFGMATVSDIFLNAEGGFYIKLIDGSGAVVDEVGNLDGKRANPRRNIGLDDPYSWNWPTDLADNKRTSLIRIYDNGAPRPGTPDREVEGSMRGAPAPLGTQVGDDAEITYSWVHAVDTEYVKTLHAKKRNIYYGNKNDYGTPGHTRGTPLPVTLSAFQPKLENGQVIIHWTTESELENAGFYILRSNSRYDEYKQVNRELIPGAGTTGERSIYKWIDTTAKQGIVYYYQIEDVTFSGKRQKLTTARLKGLISAKDRLTTTWSELKSLQ